MAIISPDVLTGKAYGVGDSLQNINQALLTMADIGVKQQNIQAANQLRLDQLNAIQPLADSYSSLSNGIPTTPTTPNSATTPNSGSNLNLIPS